MIKHTQLNQIDFSIALKETETYKSFEKFKQALVAKRKNTDRLHDYYQQAVRNGIDYLKQNQNLFANDVKMIEEVMKN